MKNVIVGLAVALLMTAAGAQAKGRILSPDELSPMLRTTLAEEIAVARKRSPGAFSQLEALAGQADAIDARKRGRFAAFPSMMRGMGEELLWPAVEMIAFTAPADGPSTEFAITTFDAGLIEAVGRFRDHRLAPLWQAILDGGEERYLVVFAAAGALAQLDTDEAAAKLVTLARTDGVRREAALAAMGNCRRLVVAKALAEALAAGPDLVTLKTLTHSLGDVGSAAAWKTPAVTHRAEEGAIRRLAAEALVAAFVNAQHPEARQAASNALMRVDAPVTPSLIKAARSGASREVATALDGLQARFDRNPAR